MDILVTQIKQIGREIMLDGNSLIGYQHSANLFIKLIKDASESNPFAGMVLSAYCSSWKSVIPIVCPLQEKEDGAYILLPEGIFDHEGDVYLSLAAIDENKVVITSNQLTLQVDESNRIVSIVSPSEKYWEIEVLNAMKVWYANVVDPTFDASNEKLNQLIRRTEEHEEKAGELQQKVQEQQNQVANAIGDAAQATQTANTAATNANEKAAAANAAAQAANKAKSDADTAAGKANKAASDANTAASNANTKAGEAATATSGAITAKNDANKAAANANEKAAAAVTATQGANTAKAAAETATKKADEITKQVQQKLNNGDFIGEKGTSYKNQGTWASGKAYKYDNKQIDTVSYSGAMYGCIKSHTSSTSITPANATYWVKMAAQGEPGPTVVKLDSETQNQLIMTKTRTANPSYVAVQFKTADGKVLAFEVPASQVIISDEVTLDTVLNGNSFYHSHTEEHLNLCNYAEWVAAGKPAMPSNFN